MWVDDDDENDDDNNEAFNIGHVSRSSFLCKIEQELNNTDTGNTELLDSDDEENSNVNAYLTSQDVAKLSFIKWSDLMLELGLNIY